MGQTKPPAQLGGENHTHHTRCFPRVNGIQLCRAQVPGCGERVGVSTGISERRDEGTECRGAGRLQSVVTGKKQAYPKIQHPRFKISAHSRPGLVRLENGGPWRSIRTCNRHFCSQHHPECSILLFLPSRTTPLLDRPRTVFVMER